MTQKFHPPANLIQGRLAEGAFDRMVIYIPTKGRATAQVTWKNLPQSWRDRSVLVVPQEDLNSVRFYNREANILVQPDDVRTIAQKRAWIIQQCPSPKLVMMDDDLVFSLRKSEDPVQTALRKAEKDDADLHTFLCEMEARLDQYAHVGMSPRQGNNRVEEHWKEVARMIYVFGFRADVAREKIEFNRVECREDMDYTLQLLKQGYKNVVGFRAAADQLKFDAPGGCKSERSIEHSNAQADLLAELHPGLVKVIEKAYKASVPRKEVIVQWKKAYEEGLRR